MLTSCPNRHLNNKNKNRRTFCRKQCGARQLHHQGGGQTRAAPEGELVTIAWRPSALAIIIRAPLAADCPVINHPKLQIRPLLFQPQLLFMERRAIRAAFFVNFVKLGLSPYEPSRSGLKNNKKPERGRASGREKG